MNIITFGYKYFEREIFGENDCSQRKYYFLGKEKTRMIYIYNCNNCNNDDIQ